MSDAARDVPAGRHRATLHGEHQAGHETTNVHAAGHKAEGHIDQLKLGFWIFLASECLFFASLIGTYLSLYHRTQSGPAPMDLFNIPLTTVSSFVLLMSSLTMVLAVSAIQAADVRAMRRWLAVTALLGLGFLGFQVFEFVTFVHEGLTLTGSIFGAAFYTLTGFHGAHAAVGVLWLISLLIYSLRRGISPHNAKIRPGGHVLHASQVRQPGILDVLSARPLSGRRGHDFALRTHEHGASHVDVARVDVTDVLMQQACGQLRRLHRP